MQCFNVLLGPGVIPDVVLTGAEKSHIKHQGSSVPHHFQ